MIFDKKEKLETPKFNQNNLISNLKGSAEANEDNKSGSRPVS